MHPLVLVGLGLGVGEGLGLGVGEGLGLGVGEGLGLGVGLGLGNQVVISMRGCINWQGAEFGTTPARAVVACIISYQTAKETFETNWSYAFS